MFVLNSLISKKIDNQIWLTWAYGWLPLPLHNKIEKVKKEKK
jgi:hypothetical protein